MNQENNFNFINNFNKISEEDILEFQDIVNQRGEYRSIWDTYKLTQIVLKNENMIKIFYRNDTFYILDFIKVALNLNENLILFMLDPRNLEYQKIRDSYSTFDIKYQIDPKYCTLYCPTLDRSSMDNLEDRTKIFTRNVYYIINYMVLTFGFRDFAEKVLNNQFDDTSRIYDARDVGSALFKIISPKYSKFYDCTKEEIHDFKYYPLKLSDVNKKILSRKRKIRI